jgi:hypothetical protein
MGRHKASSDKAGGRITAQIHRAGVVSREASKNVLRFAEAFLGELRGSSAIFAVKFFLTHPCDYVETTVEC